MHIDLIQLIKDALNHAGCADRIAEDLDPHAAVELHFGASPMMRVALTEENAVQITACLYDQVDAPAGCIVSSLVKSLGEPADWANHGCISLLNINEQLHLHAIVDPTHLNDGEAFSQALSGFYDRLTAVYQALHG